MRSTSEVFMHVALANFYLLSVTGPNIHANEHMVQFGQMVAYARMNGIVPPWSRGGKT